MKQQEHIGEKYNRLTVIDVRREGKRYYWTCRCECGNVTESRADQIRTGHTKSCGCRALETRYKFRHGEWKTPLFNKWQKMRARCNSPKDKYYKNYGGRGIKVCDEWEDYVVFSKWAHENGYEDSLSLERKDVNGDYCPSNCCWIPINKQARNRTTTRWVDCDGKRMSLAEACEVKGMPYGVVQSRLRRGWNEYDALNKPLKEVSKC